MIYLLYLDSRCFFINALNVKRVLHVFRDSGSKFHVSGPWCLIDLWARGRFHKRVISMTVIAMT